MDSWLDKELSSCIFKDKRLTERFKTIIKTLSKRCGKSIPKVCEEWSMAKATYRFLSNDRVDNDDILAGHYDQTKNRIGATRGPILILHDTTEFSYKRESPKAIGHTRKLPTPDRIAKAFGQQHKACGVLMHASMAITAEGLPLGLTAIKFWSREVFKNTTKLKSKINPTRVPISAKESIKWLENLNSSNERVSDSPAKLVHIGDRENDIYEYLCQCQGLGSYFVVRSCVDRLANETTLAEEVATSKAYYKHVINFTDSDGNTVNTAMNIKVKTLALHPPIGKEANYPDLRVTVVSALEAQEPVGRERIKWTFLTNLPVKKKENALTVLNWYKQRWKIETYFKILKSGLKLEESKLRTAARLTRLISICCILAWRIHWLTMLNREDKRLSPNLAFDDIERKILIQYFQKIVVPSTLQDYIDRLARLGGYLARASDPPPGNTVIWRGMNKLYELRAGFELALGVGN
ncbi:IS4 family transposase [uncultured Microbulbifer sp.]|uniref:IS4 family transposase n=1 Tax=uncultured Microbulbifer sp. TaxID=348147 RepID=UPI0026367ABB|nr:IS4 family transposase [uncultured Microbulbifer sp.]